MARVVMALKVEGLAQLRRELLRHRKRFLEEMARALPVEATSLRGDTDALAPRATGQLASSSVVSVATTETKVRAVVAYTDEKAAAVHEGVHYGHRVQGTRGFKWFERAFNAFEAGFLERLAARLRRLTGGGA